MVFQYKHKRTIHCTYEGALFSPKSIAFSPGGQYIAAAIGSSVCLWNCDTGEKQFEMPWDNTKALSVAWTHRRQFLGGFSDGMLLAATIDVAQEANHTLSGFDPLNSPIEFIALHHSHSSIALGGGDIVQVWKPKESHADLEHVMTIPPPPATSRSNRKVQVTSIGWVNSDTVVVSYLNNGILVWRINTEESEMNYCLRPQSELPVRNQCPRGFVAPDESDPGDDRSHRPAAFIHGGTTLLGASGRKVFLWDLKTLVGFHVPLSVPSGQLLQLAGECDDLTNRFLIAGSTNSGQINIWKSHQVNSKDTKYKSPTRSSQRSRRLYFAITFVILLAVFIFICKSRARYFKSS
ncbi:WD40-repeat-containing domain superfamily protein [Pleurotus pulmonarius]